MRSLLFEGKLKQTQVDGLNEILDEWEAAHAKKDDRFLAYMLATTYHETDKTMQPIEEYGKGKGKAYGKPDPVTGKTYYGRGYVQLTWKENYRKMGAEIKLDLVNNPDSALTNPAATKILFSGMLKGMFTGKKLADYFNGSTEDWVNARRIINGKDKANLIASHARKFYMAISHTV